MELGAGLALPGLDMARRESAGKVTITDSRPSLLELTERNAARAAASQKSAGRAWADVRVARLDWNDAGDKDGEDAKNGVYDVLYGADVCYVRQSRSRPFLLTLISSIWWDLPAPACELLRQRHGSRLSFSRQEEDSVPPLADLVTTHLRAKLTYIIGPAGRPSMAAMAKRLAATPGVQLEERLLTLTCINASSTVDEHLGTDTERADARSVHSAGVHRLLIVRQGASDPPDVTR